MLGYIFLKNVKVSRVKFHDVICREKFDKFPYYKDGEVENEIAR